MHGESA